MAVKYHGRPCKRCGGTLRYKNSNCVECIKIHAGKYKKNNPEKVAASKTRWRERNPDYGRRRLYGVDQAWIKQTIENQGGCGICHTQDPGSSGWQVDHDHTTGKVRGVLCVKCNTGLGSFRDSIEFLGRAISYLKP